MAYIKLFASLLTSTLWVEDHTTVRIWITVLLLADKNGEVIATIPGLAHQANATVEETEAAIKRFLSPDPYSRSKEAEGRRLEEIEGGWLLINHAKYREMESREDRMRANRQRQKRFYDKNRNTNPNTSELDQIKPDAYPVHADADADADADTEEEHVLHAHSTLRDAELEELILRLEASHVYGGMDIRHEYEKCVLWYKTHVKGPPDSGRFINWLDRAFRPKKKPDKGTLIGASKKETLPEPLAPLPEGIVVTRENFEELAGYPEKKTE